MPKKKREPWSLKRLLSDQEITELTNAYAEATNTFVRFTYAVRDRQLQAKSFRMRALIAQVAEAGGELTDITAAFIANNQTLLNVMSGVARTVDEILNDELERINGGHAANLELRLAMERITASMQLDSGVFD